MDQEKQKEYTARIAQANRSELVVIIDELILVSIDEAQEAFARGEKKEGVAVVKRAQGFLQELMGSLDMKYEISAELKRLYRYVYGQLIASVVREELVNPDSVKNVMEKLKRAFTEVAKQDKSGPVMQNVQQVYAGLTYGKDALDEEVMLEGEKKRGFRV